MARTAFAEAGDWTDRRQPAVTAPRSPWSRRRPGDRRVPLALMGHPSYYRPISSGVGPRTLRPTCSDERCLAHRVAAEVLSPKFFIASRTQPKPVLAPWANSALRYGAWSRGQHPGQPTRVGRTEGGRGTSPNMAFDLRSYLNSGIDWPCKRVINVSLDSANRRTLSCVCAGQRTFLEPPVGIEPTTYSSLGAGRGPRGRPSNWPR